MAHCIDDKAWNQCAVGIGADHLWWDDLFGRKDHPPGGKGRFFLLPDNSPDVGITLGIGALHVHDRHIRVERRHDHHLAPEYGSVTVR